MPDETEERVITAPGPNASVTQTEPIGLTHLIMAVLMNALLGATAFGFQLSAEQVAVIQGFVGSVLLLVAFIYGRSRVTPVA
jgi:hypothetical protein